MAPNPDPSTVTVLVGGPTLLFIHTPSVTVNGLGLVAVPPGVVTVTEPDVANAGTPVVIVVLFFTLKLGPTLTPLNFTAVAPVKFVPVIVTSAPTGPLAGVNVVIVGAVACATPGINAPTNPTAAPNNTSERQEPRPNIITAPKNRTNPAHPTLTAPTLDVHQPPRLPLTPAR